jgi:23S rRNA (adenine-N6)-dimethyltransferase
VAGRRARSARPPRPRSQHFLRSPVLAAAIVRNAGVGADDIVLDLGAGSGRLTAELARVARRVVAVELDPRWAARLRGRWENVDVVEGDAVRLRLPDEPFRVVANVPFDRTTDLLHLLLDDPRTPLVRADLIVEWAVAVKRAVPWPSTLNGVVWSAFYELGVARRLPPGAFAPPPAVPAGVLVCRRRAEPLVPPAHAHAYRSFVARGFRHGVRGAVARELDAYQWAERFSVRTNDPPTERARADSARGRSVTGS